jgi:hypothetical protein
MASRLKCSSRMRKTNKSKKPLALHTETVRALHDDSLVGANGGYYNSYIICQDTAYYTCHPKTPNCPQ